MTDLSVQGLVLPISNGENPHRGSSLQWSCFPGRVGRALGMTCHLGEGLPTVKMWAICSLGMYALRLKALYKVRLCGGFFLSSLRTERGRSKDCFKICMYYVVPTVFFLKHLGMGAGMAAYFLL